MTYLIVVLLVWLALSIPVAVMLGRFIAVSAGTDVPKPEYAAPAGTVAAGTPVQCSSGDADLGEMVEVTTHLREGVPVLGAISREA